MDASKCSASSLTEIFIRVHPPLSVFIRVPRVCWSVNSLISLRQHPYARWIGTLLIVAALLALPLVLATVGTAWVRITNLAILFVLLSLGLNIVVGFAGLLDLGYIAFYAVGAYTYALLASPHFGLHLPWWVILPIGAAIACLFGILLGAPTLKLRGDYLAIVTLGFGEIVRICLNNLSEPFNLTNGPKGISTIDPVRVLGNDFSTSSNLAGLDFSGTIKYYYFLLVLLVVVIVVNLRLQNSRIGRAWEAIREDELAARSMGINTRNMKLLAFAMGASFAGVAGGMFSAIQQFISPESFILVESVMVLSMVVLGGMGNIWGVVLGALLLSFVPEILRYTVEPMQRAVFGRSIIDPEVIRMLLFGLAMVVMMIFRPAGLFPSAVRKRELARPDAPPAA
jgi:branched-chain amino acid transport system permease protein